MIGARLVAASFAYCIGNEGRIQFTLLGQRHVDEWGSFFVFPVDWISLVQQRDVNCSSSSASRCKVAKAVVKVARVAEEVAMLLYYL